MRNLIILTGGFHAGKTTLSKELKNEHQDISIIGERVNEIFSHLPNWYSRTDDNIELALSSYLTLRLFDHEEKDNEVVIVDGYIIFDKVHNNNSPHPLFESTQNKLEAYKRQVYNWLCNFHNIVWVNMLPFENIEGRVSSNMSDSLELYNITISITEEFEIYISENMGSNRILSFMHLYNMQYDDIKDCLLDRIKLWK